MRLAFAALLAALAVPLGRAAAAEKYFALFFAYQDRQQRPENSHTFVEYIRAEIEPGAPPVILQRDLISWLPANGIVRLHAFRAEEGRNSTLEETLAVVDAKGLDLYSWGPYELTPCAYRWALKRKEELESGSVAYKAVDRFTFANRSANCVHAAADLDPDAKHVGEYNVKYGQRATKQVIRHYDHSGYLCNPCCVHDDVFQALGFDGRCLDRRNDWQVNGPLSGIRR